MLSMSGGTTASTFGIVHFVPYMIVARPVRPCSFAKYFRRTISNGDAVALTSAGSTDAISLPISPQDGIQSPNPTCRATSLSYKWLHHQRTVDLLDFGNFSVQCEQCHH